jgi:hypothetical protein
MVRLRKAGMQDLGAIVSIKEALRLLPGQAAGRGGFLLGCSPERYAQLIERANVLLLEEAGEAFGFAVTLPDPLLRTSELWQRRAAIQWTTGEGEPPAGGRVAYFDQLALRPGASRRHAPALAFAAVQELAVAGHGHLYATIIDAPVRNEAALPLMRVLRTRVVGMVEEHYPEAGRVVSELHYVALGHAMAALEKTALGLRTAGATTRLAA